jgi:hypothetical protein
MSGVPTDEIGDGLAKFDGDRSRSFDRQTGFKSGRRRSTKSLYGGDTDAQGIKAANIRGE